MMIPMGVFYILPPLPPDVDSTKGSFGDTITAPEPVPISLIRKIHDATIAFEKERGRTLPERLAVGLSPADLESIHPAVSANPESLKLFGLPVVVVTPEIRSQIDGIRAFRAATGLRPAVRFGLMYHEGIPVLIPMDD